MPEGPASWDEVYATRRADEVSWFQREPEVSLHLVTLYAATESAVVDVGAGASLLADRLVERGYSDVTLVDLSSVALAQVTERLGDSPVHVIVADVLEWRPDRRYDLWHDRAVLHFLVEEDDRKRYVEKVSATLAPGGFVVIGVFALDGPTHCSGREVHRYDQEALADLFAPAFTLVRSDRELHVTPGGATQPFTWAVLARGN